jgi:hypothetical protein
MNEMENIASALYGETSAKPSLLGLRPTETEREAFPLMDERTGQNPPEDPLESLYQDGGEGDPPSTYDPHLNELFDGQEKKARIDHDHQQLEVLSVARKGMEAVLKEFKVGDSAAKSIMITARNYVDNPRTFEQIEAASVVTSKDLKEKWGADFDKMMAGAKRVLSEAARKVPGLMDMVNNTGLGNDKKTIIALANAARRKGYVK